jgi:hypothetical protein
MDARTGGCVMKKNDQLFRSSHAERQWKPAWGTAPLFGAGPADLARKDQAVSFRAGRRGDARGVNRSGEQSFQRRGAAFPMREWKEHTT